MPNLVPEPASNSILWRYMSLSRFVGMLTQKGLYMSRSDGFPEKWEVPVGPLEFGADFEKLLQKSLGEVLGGDDKLGDADGGGYLNGVLAEMSDFNRNIRLNTFISCWHESIYDSEARWKLYSSNTPEAVCIVTDCKTLKKVIPKKYDISIGAIQYQYPKYGPLGPLHRFYYKRPEFKHEQEVRLLYYREDTEPDDEVGLIIPVDLNRLIKAVVISPYAPGWVHDSVVETCTNFQIKAPVRLSELGGKPFRF